MYPRIARWLPARQRTAFLFVLVYRIYTVEAHGEFDALLNMSSRIHKNMPDLPTDSIYNHWQITGPRYLHSSSLCKSRDVAGYPLFLIYKMFAMWKGSSRLETVRSNSCRPTGAAYVQ